MNFAREHKYQATRYRSSTQPDRGAPHRSMGNSALRQRSLGNAYLATRAQVHGDKGSTLSNSAVLPHMRIKHFSKSGGNGIKNLLRIPDKSDESSEGITDQNASVTSFGTRADTPTKRGGVNIVVEAEGLTSTPDYPDDYRWTQTIDTNVPLGGTSSPYVDPRPNDDAKPFYWTDAEHASRPTTFSDAPGRAAPASGTTTWQATLSLNGVNGTDVTRLDSLTYGFTRDSSGTITEIAPASPGSGMISTHQATLRSEFSGWTFS